MKRLFFSGILLFFCSRATASGFEFTANCRSAYQEMLQFNFIQAAALLSKEKAVRPDNGAIYYIEHYSDFLRAFVSEEDKDFFELKNNLDKRLEAIQKKEIESPWIKLAEGEMLLQLAVVKLKRKEYLSAGYYIRRAYKILEENQAQYPKFLPNLKSLGFLHAVIGAVPENYKWLSNLAGLRGTIQQGGNELSLVINKLPDNDEMAFIKTETSFLKIFIATHLEKDCPSALALLEKTNKETDSKSPLLVFLEANTLITAGRPADALNVLKTFQPSKSQYPLFYLEYLTGMLKLNNLDFEAAQNFTRFTDGFRGNSFQKSAWHKLAWISLLKNDTASYFRNLEKVKTVGNDFTDEDKQALKETASTELPNIYLLRSRLLFDGGNYNSALAELAGKPSSTFTKYRDQLEFTYRLARIFDKKGQTAKAIQYYTTTYNNGMRAEWYFAANAALHNGLLYEEKGDLVNARIWYKNCLALRSHEYQNSIDQKAEAGLNRINH